MQDIIYLKSDIRPPHSKDEKSNQQIMNWPHAPLHWIFEQGIYMVTAGTYQKASCWNTPERLEFLQQSLFDVAQGFDWALQAWSILSNHYHFIAQSPENSNNLKRFVGKLHMTTAKQLNEWDKQPGRKVWFQFWDTRITFEKSYLARLNYVHFNPQKHGAVTKAEDYKWCSAGWFVQNASSALVKTVRGFKTDRLNVPDDF